MLFSLCALAVYYMQIRKLDFLKALCATPICCVFLHEQMETFDFRGQNYEFMLRRNEQFKLFLYEKAKKIAFRLFFFRKILAQKQGMCQYCVAHP